MNEFKNGQLLFYPLHGVGLLEATVTALIQERKTDYYKLYFRELEMHVFIPQNSVELLGLRPLCDLETIKNSWIHFFSMYTKLPDTASMRKRVIDKKLESGDSFNLAEVIRDLVCASKYELRLTSRDKHSLQTACNMAICELMYVAKLSNEKASSIVKKSIDLRIKGKKSEFTSYVRKVSREYLK